MDNTYSDLTNDFSSLTSYTEIRNQCDSNISPVSSITNDKDKRIAVFIVNTQSSNVSCPIIFTENAKFSPLSAVAPCFYFLTSPRFASVIVVKLQLSSFYRCFSRNVDTRRFFQASCRIRMKFQQRQVLKNVLSLKRRVNSTSANKFYCVGVTVWLLANQ